MDALRRTLLKGAGATGALTAAIAAGLLKPSQVLAAEWNRAAFDAKDMAGALKGLGATGAADNAGVVIKAPDIAENGAVVPVGVSSSMPKVESIAILVEKNPSPLTAVFAIPAGTEPSVTTRVKMGQSSLVYALVKSDGKVFVASKEIKVTLGGCGG